MSTILTLGTFDGVHVGHLELLRECRRLAGDGRVIVALNRDEFVERYKGRRPTFTYAQRAEMVAAVVYVDSVVCNVGDEDAKTAIEVVRPDWLAIGDDWLDPGHDERRYHAQLGVTPEWLDARGLGIVYVPRTRGVSSSALRGAA